jgi:hypothetical protein
MEAVGSSKMVPTYDTTLPHILQGRDLDFCKKNCWICVILFAFVFVHIFFQDGPVSYIKNHLLSLTKNYPHQIKSDIFIHVIIILKSYK